MNSSLARFVFHPRSLFCRLVLVITSCLMLLEAEFFRHKDDYMGENRANKLHHQH